MRHSGGVACGGGHSGVNGLSVETTPHFTIAESVHLARRFYGLSAASAPLPSERDQNFALITTTGERFVLKIAMSIEERATLELQNAALKHAAGRVLHLSLPRLIRASDGADIVTIRGAGGQNYFMRLMSWLDGEVFVHTPRPHDGALLASLGTAMAELDLALQGFPAPAMHRELYWDLKRANLALAHLALLPDEQQSVVLQYMNAWDKVDWNSLRHSLIHGDVNDYNVLVRGGRVIGLLDFGDMVYSAVVCDLAIVLAYALLEESDPLAAALPIVHAYHVRFPLTQAEIQALYPLMTARLCMSICYAAHSAQIKSGDAYQLVTADPAWRLLQRLAELPKDAAAVVFRQACATA
jgi:Ser/Thr protein kinase RdoA (MazF antagonist)